MKKLLLILFAVLLLASVMSFPTLADGVSFTDVPENAWYYADVMSAVEMGLINGKSATKYCPDDYLTYAEAAKLAACMNERYTKREVTLKNGEINWYDTYVSYCIANGIMDGPYGLLTNVTRSGYMEMFAKALPEDALKPINNVPLGSIPDIDVNAKYADEVYTLYRAGILQGSDAKHSCNPYGNIKRSEVAAILSRMMNPEKRITFSMGTEQDIKPLVITYQPQDITVKPGDQLVVGVSVTGGKEPYKYRWQASLLSTDGEYSEWKYLDKLETLPSTTVNDKIFTASIPDDLESGKRFLVRCEITDAPGNIITSKPAVIDCISSLRVLKQPTNTEVIAGQTATVSVEVTGGTAPYSYRWMMFLEENQTWGHINSLAESFRRGFDCLTDSTLTYKISEATIKRVRCEITDSKGTKVLSNDAFIVVNSDPAQSEKDSSQFDESTDGEFRFILKRGDQYPASGNDIVYDCKVIGGKAPLKYQWEIRSGRDYIAIDNAGEGVKGEKTATLSYVFYPTRVINGRTIRLTVTDADGKTASCEPFTTPLGIFVMDVEDKINISTASGVEGTIVVGTVLDGSIVPGQSIFVYNEKLGLSITGTVSRIEMFGKSLDKAEKGDNCGLFLEKNSIETVIPANVVNMLPNNSTTRSIILNTVTDGYALTVSFALEQILNACGDNKENVTVGPVKVIGGTAPYEYCWGEMDPEKGFTPLNDDDYYTNTRTNELAVKIRKDRDYEKNFVCRVKDAQGKELYTNQAKIFPKNLTIIKQPERQYANYGESVSFSVKVAKRGRADINGNYFGADCSYIWQAYTRSNYNGDYVDIDEKTDTWAKGANTDTLTFDYLERFLFSDTSMFRCKIIDYRGDVYYTDEVYVFWEKPYVYSQPSETIYTEVDQTARLKLEIKGNYTPFTYRWQFTCDMFDGIFMDISKDHAWAKGINSSELRVFVEGNDKYDESLRFRCVITDANGNELITKVYRIVASGSPSVELKG